MGERTLALSALHAQPWPHIEVSLNESIARQIADHWPVDGWKWLRHSDIVRPDGTSLRKYQPIEMELAQQLFATETEFRKVLGAQGNLYPIAQYVEDLPGYKIRRHTDCAGKVISCQIYLADDDWHENQGVHLQTYEGTKVKQIPYLFNRGYAFKVTGWSWHRVKESNAGRKSIQLIWYDRQNPVI